MKAPGDQASTVGSLEGPVIQPQAWPRLEVAKLAPSCAPEVEGGAQLPKAEEEPSSSQKGFTSTCYTRSGVNEGEEGGKEKEQKRS